MNPSLPNASKSFQTLNPRLFGQPEGKNDSTVNLARPRGGLEARVMLPGQVMNSTEAKFALRLEEMKREGEIDGWMYESIRLRLADRTTYTPDFFSWVGTHMDNQGNSTMEDGVQITFYEVKGFRRDDALVKYKVAREQYPWADFQMWELKKGGWKQIY